MQLNKISTARLVKISLWIVLVILIVLAGWWFVPHRLIPMMVLPDKQKITLEFADTAAERTQGLSGRASLAADTGMLFVFDDEGQYPFWMPEMKFSLDMIWLDSQYRIVYLKQNVPPAGSGRKDLVQYINDQPAKYVLEVNAGVAVTHQLQVGSQLTYREIKSW